MVPFIGSSPTATRLERPSSIRFADGSSGFLILIHRRDRPLAYAKSRRLATMLSWPRPMAAFGSKADLTFMRVEVRKGPRPCENSKSML